MKALICLIFIMNSTFADDKESQEFIDEFAAQELAPNIFEEVESLRKKRIKKIVESKMSGKKRFDRSYLLALSVKLDDIFKSPTRTFYIPKGTSLINIETDKMSYLPQGITVNAHTKLDEQEYRYIRTKTGEVLYKVYFEYTTPLKEITNLKRPPVKFIPETKKKIKVFKQKTSKLIYKFDVHQGFTGTDSVGELVDTRNAFSLLTRVSTQALWGLQNNYALGLGLSYETISTSSFSWTSLSVGPSFNKTTEGGKYTFVVNPSVSFSSDVTTSISGVSTSYTMSETALFIGAEVATSPTKQPKGFYLGMGFQGKWSRIRAVDTALDINDAQVYDNALLFYFGHRSDWIW